jgi:hypothetical protein
MLYSCSNRNLGANYITSFILKKEFFGWKDLPFVSGFCGLTYHYISTIGFLFLSYSFPLMICNILFGVSP